MFRSTNVSGVLILPSSVHAWSHIKPMIMSSCTCMEKCLEKPKSLENNNGFLIILSTIHLFVLQKMLGWLMCWLCFSAEGFETSRNKAIPKHFLSVY